MPVTAFRFFRETRAGATAFVAAAVTMMTLGGAALIVDHVWLVDQRDMLKSASDAGAIAATLELQDLPRTMSDENVSKKLQPVAERYVRLNLAQNLAEAPRKKMEETLKVSIDVNRTLGTVGVTSQADLGGTLLSKWFLSYAGPDDGVRVESGGEGSLGATEVVLLIDTTGSMKLNLRGRQVNEGSPESRMEIVRQAARQLVSVLSEYENRRLALGIVPWTYRVRLDEKTRASWEAKDWATYPKKREYPHASVRSAGPPGPEAYLEKSQQLPRRTRLPSACRAWTGCLDMRMKDGFRSAPSFSLALPSKEPFTMNFFTERARSGFGLARELYVSYACQSYGQQGVVRPAVRPVCYDIDRAPSTAEICESGSSYDGHATDTVPLRFNPQDDCGGSPIVPLTSDMDKVRKALDDLETTGSTTYSSVGVAWGLRLLSPAWRGVWGHAEHPLDSDTDVQKVLVLLTDGEDRYLDSDVARQHRETGCQTAKDAGIKVFVIAAMHPNLVRDAFGQALRQCSSASDDPEGKYVFVNNATPEKLKEAFAEVATQLVRLKRTH